MRILRTIFAGLFLVTATLTVAGQTSQPSNDEPGEVLLGGKSVVVLKTRVRGWSPQVRAQSISDRLTQFANDRSLPSDLLVVHETELGSEIGSDDRLVMLVIDADAQAVGRERPALANDIAQSMRAAIDQYRFERSRSRLVRGVLLALLATVLLLGGLFVLNRVYRRAMSATTNWIDGQVEIIRGKSADLIPGETLKSALLATLRLACIILVVTVLYLYLDVVLSLFPVTQPFATQLTSYVLVPIRRIGAATVREIPNFFFILVVVVITRYALKFVHALFARLDDGTITIEGFYPDWAMPTYRIVRILVLAFAVVMAYPYIPGSESEAFKGISIFLGVLLSLGSSSVVANVVAGLTMVYMRSFKVGDRVQIGELVGNVTNTRLQVTHLRTIKNEEIIVPNSKIINSEVINFSSLARDVGLILHTEVRIGYQTPWRQVHALLLLAAKRTEGILRDPAPFILQKSLDNLYVTYELNIYVDSSTAMVSVYSDLHKNIQDAFNEYDVQIMSPNYENDRAERPVVPKDRWYAAPAAPPDLAAMDAD